LTCALHPHYHANPFYSSIKYKARQIEGVSKVAISFSDRVRVPEAVLVSGLQDESVMLNLDSERYYGLDDVGTRMFSVLTTSDSIESAFEVLLGEYDVDREVLRNDLVSLIDKLLEQGLVEVLNQ
jgi:hypothetical protein